MTLRISRSRMVAIIATLLVLAQLTAWPAPSPTRAAADFTVATDEATSNFPDGINFTLDVQARRTIRRVELLYQSADLATLHLSVPEFEPSKHIELTHLLNFRVFYQPSGIDITYRWRFVDDRDNEFETESRTLLWADNRFNWLPVASTDVTVYGYNQNEAYNSLILESAQSTVDRLKTEFGLTRITPIRIWVYNSKQDFSATQQGNSSHWVAGTAYPDLHVILAILPEGNKREVGRVIPHEISHQLLNQATDNPFNVPPTWLDEGLAVLHQDNGNEDFPAMVEDAAEKGRLFSIRALNSNFPYDPADATLAYAESYSIVKFIIDTFGEDGLSAVIAAYRDGVSHDQALRQGLGIGLDELDRRWKESLDYQGDQPRSSGSSRDDTGWTNFLGTGFATGSLLLAIALLSVALYRLTTSRRFHGSASRAG